MSLKCPGTDFYSSLQPKYLFKQSVPLNLKEIPFRQSTNEQWREREKYFFLFPENIKTYLLFRRQKLKYECIHKNN